MRFGCQLVPIWLPKIHQNQVLEASWSLLEPSWGPLGPSWRHLEASWSHLGASWCLLAPLRGILEASWGSKIHGRHRRRWIRGAVAEVQGPLLRIFQDFPVCISLVYTEEMEVRKEKRRKGRLEYRTPYAMRRHKAWRGGYPKRSKAANPPPRL